MVELLDAVVLVEDGVAVVHGVRFLVRIDVCILRNSCIESRSRRGCHFYKGMCVVLQLRLFDSENILLVV